jgi:serine/threonine-protein kinase RsbW
MSTEAAPRCEFDDKKLVLRLDLEIPGDPSAISPVVQGVLHIASQMKCAQGKEFAIETALREALANAVRHGCGNDPSRRVECSVLCDESRGMLIVVRDPGPGFDPRRLPSPVQGQNLFEAHGRGIYLINQLMDEVRFEKGGCEIHMRKG